MQPRGASFTLRGLMIAVADVATVFGLVADLYRRQERFRRIASYHESANPLNYPCSYFLTDPGRAEWHATMQVKYEHAASHPWEPVAPDPLEPQPKTLDDHQDESSPALPATRDPFPSESNSRD